MPLLKAGQIEIVAAVEGFDGPSVLLADGTRIQPEAVIAATGYRRGLEPLVGHLGVLGEDGIPLVSGGNQGGERSFEPFAATVSQTEPTAPEPGSERVG